MIIRPRWRKVLRDMWGNKTRTILVVLSIAVGVFAVGMIANARIILDRDLAQSYAATNPASARLLVSYLMLGGGEGFDDDLVQVVQRMRNVAAAEGRRSLSVRLNVGADEWRDLQIFAIPDYDNIRINKVWSESGAWPPPYREMLIERAALGLTNAAVGDTVLLKMPNGLRREVRIAGLAHDLSQLPAFLDGTIYAYVTFETLEWLGEPRDYNEMYIVVEGDKYNKEHVQVVANEVRNKIEKSGRSVLMTIVLEPGKHPLSDAMQTIVLLLGVLGFFSLLLSGFLVINTISALLAQQVRQIGIMKAIGARSYQIMGLYLVMVLIFGVLSLLIAVPLGALGAQLFTRFMAGLFNFDLADFYVPGFVIILEVAVGLMIPSLAALYPIITGTRVTVREAMSDYGLGVQRALHKMHHSRRIANLSGYLTALPGLSRPLLLSLRNTFRRKGRLVLTLTTLTLAGAIFIGVFSVRDSLLTTLDDLMDTWQYDVQVTLSRPHRIEQIEDVALSVPGVVTAKGAGFTVTRRVRADKTESDSMFLMAPPVDADLVRPVIVAGRWLHADDENAIVVSTNFLSTEPDLNVGDSVVLKIDGRDTTWHIVGVSQFLAPISYVDYADYARAARNAGRASSVWVVTERSDLAFQSQVAQQLEQQFERASLRINSVAKIAEERAEAEATFEILVILLLLMAVLLAFVGGLGLMGTMSINVLERTREIGVMRAIGASNGSIQQIVLVEGVLIGSISWLLGAMLAIPLSKLLSDAVGMAFWQSPLSYSFSVGGALIWFVTVVLLSAVASFLPAWNASRLTVRDVLAYE